MSQRLVETWPIKSMRKKSRLWLGMTRADHRKKNQQILKICWLVVTGTMEFEWLSIQLGMSWSQLTKSIIFQRGRANNHQPAMWRSWSTNQLKIASLCCSYCSPRFLSRCRECSARQSSSAFWPQNLGKKWLGELTQGWGKVWGVAIGCLYSLIVCMFYFYLMFSVNPMVYHG